MSGVDYARLRDQTLGSSQEEEAVTVNTRALIDKVLARYSGEWTTFRELIQNAADANATKISIKFETIPLPSSGASSHSDLRQTVLSHTLKRVVVSNNGQPFDKNDWARLKRIAEGNPDETKIGAFGVGFYSVFADCENPLVTSGRESMAFYWKGNSLFTRKGTLPSDHPGSDTTFVLDYRNATTPVPNLLSICQFLSTSLTFIALEKIELWLDGWSLFTLHKKAAPPFPVALPKELDTKTKQSMMRITSVECHNAQIDASWMNIVGWKPVSSDKPNGTTTEPESKNSTSLRSFFSKLTGSSYNNAATKRAAREEEAAQKVISEDLAGRSTATVFTRVNTVHVKSQVASSFAAELERATKKPPPKTTKIAVLTSSYDEASASMSTLTGNAASKASEIISSILPSRAGRIFIGFPTAQTTGLLAHISAPSLIPTVERESIDLNARWVRDWNSELLNVAGIACRLAYSGEMASLRSKLKSSIASSKSDALDEDAVSALYPAAVHTLKQYSFGESTPLARAGQLIEESFWTCSKKASIEMFSSRGILPSSEVRIASEDLTFVNKIPVVPEALMKDAQEFISKLQDFGLISDITTSDIKNELERQALSEKQLMEFLKWASHKVKINELDGSAVRSLLNVVVANVANEDDPSKPASIVTLNDIKSFINSSRISPDNPTPSHTIPFRFTKGIGQNEMQAFGWEELQVVPWLRWLLEASSKKDLTSEQDLTSSPHFAAQILGVVSKNWDSLSPSSKATVVELLAPRTVMPTKFGMRKPSDAYFTSVKLFDDLPTISGMSGIKEKFLKSLGVRKTIELSVIFDRLMQHSKDSKDPKSSSEASWSHVDLIKYLVSVWSDIPQADIAQLRATPLCPAENGGNSEKSPPTYFKMSELFEPLDSLRALGLPILQWPTVFNAYSNEGKFLRLLGLRPYPSVPELVDIMVKAHSGKNPTQYDRCLNYFIDNHYQNNYGSFDMANVQIPFLPLENSEANQLVKPEDCYIDAKAEALSYPILRKDLQPHGTKLGVKQNPPIADCAQRLIRSPPKTRADARHIYSYLAGRITDITKPIADKLGSSAIVPLASGARSSTSKDSVKSSSVRFVAPKSCFLGDAHEYGDIFDYVDFGPEANVFLLTVGSKHEPSIIEITRSVIHDPKHIFHILGIQRYMDLLRKLQINSDVLKKEKLLWKEMRGVPFLLAFRESSTKTNASQSSESSELDDLDDDVVAPEVETGLYPPGAIVLLDDVISFKLFKGNLVVAPQEDALEDFYSSLGSPYLSSLIDQESRLGPRSRDQQAAMELQELIFERARLFLYEQNPNTIRHDIKWLEKNLEVQTVQSISLRRSLRGQNLSHTERRSAAVQPNAKNKPILSITAKYDSWQVSHAVVSLLVDRPKTQSTIVFENFLTTPLLRLRARGYNVDRILRKKAAEEAKLAELERQRHAEEQRIQEERNRIEEAQRSHSNGQVISAEARDDSGGVNSTFPQEPRIPGAFQDSPQQHVEPQNQLETQRSGPKNPESFLSHLTRSLGLENRTGSRNPIRDMISAHGGQSSRANTGQSSITSTPPPPYTPNASNNNNMGEAVTHPSSIAQNLQRAIGASRAYDSNSLFSRPETNVVKEISSYCDAKPSQDIRFLGNVQGVDALGATSSVKVFAAAETPIEFLAIHEVGLNAFAGVLLAAGSVFGMPVGTIHIFFDESGSTIAFNSQGSVFCNYRFFQQLHLHAFQSDHHEAKIEAIIYWWVTLCHELAHNLVSDHSSNHSFYTEQFVASYFPSIAGLAINLQRQS